MDTTRNGLVNRQRLAFFSDFFQFFSESVFHASRAWTEIGVARRHTGYLLTVIVFKKLFSYFAMSENDIFQ